MRPGLRAAFPLFVLLLSASCSPIRPIEELWLYFAANLADPAELARLESVWRRAAAAGYTRVVLADGKFARLGTMDEAYFTHLRRAQDLARELGLEIIPGVFPIGRSNSLLAHDPNLAEGLPIRDALFEVHDGVARLVPDPPVGFGPRPDSKHPWVHIRDGVATVRDHFLPARFMYRLAVHPFRCYRITVQVKTQDYAGRPLVQVRAGGRAIHFPRSLGVEPTQDWTAHTTVFHSLGHSEVQVHFGGWGKARGTLSWTQWRIEEVGPVNLLRRAGAPFEVAGYVEGRDFRLLRDRHLGVTPWAGQYEAWHEPPVLETNLPEGTRLRASWYSPAVIENGQVMCCISEPAVEDLLRDEAERVRAAWNADGYLMMHDEIRSLNWDESCRRRNLTPGMLLADHVRFCTGLLAGAKVYVWSDMFDPHHNAVANYYLVNGDLAGSWEGLTPEVVIVNWNAAQRDRSLRFFADRGHRQVVAGYFDGNPDEIRDWLRSAAQVPGVTAVMYTTWRGNYADLEGFARVCRGES